MSILFPNGPAQYADDLTRTNDDGLPLYSEPKAPLLGTERPTALPAPKPAAQHHAEQMPPTSYVIAPAPAQVVNVAAPAPAPIVNVTNVQRASFRRTAHVFHLLLTLLTGGLWLIVYLPLVISRHGQNRKNGY